MFEPGGPIQKGNIAQLLNEGHAAYDVVNESGIVVKTAVPGIPLTSTLMQLVQNSTVNSPLSLTTCKLPSPRKLKRDCENCVTKQGAIMNMLQKNKGLHQQLRKFKKLFMEENGNFSVERFSENIKRQTQSVTHWKTKYYTLVKACRVRSTQKLFKLVHELEQKVKNL